MSPAYPHLLVNHLPVAVALVAVALLLASGLDAVFAFTANSGAIRHTELLR